MLQKISYKIEDLELRTVDTELISTSNYLATAEIVLWTDNSCYTIAFWKISKEGYYLVVVSNRLLKKNINIFYKLYIVGQLMLDEYYE